jgi:hypothetical protein
VGRVELKDRSINKKTKNDFFQEEKTTTHTAPDLFVWTSPSVNVIRRFDHSDARKKQMHDSCNHPCHTAVMLEKED